MTRAWGGGLTRGSRAAAGSLLAALLLSVLLGTAGSAAAATPAPPDTAVTTRDGAAYQGVLVEQIPGDHVTIQTADGRIHTFPSSEVATVRPLGARGVTPLPSAESERTSGVLVDLSTSDPNARLVQLATSGGAPAAANPEICGPPCGVHVAPGTYVIGGGGIIPSSAFTLPSVPGHVRITTEPVTTEHRSTSVILAAGGGISAVSVGLPLWLTGVLLEDAENNETSTGLQTSTTHVGSTVKWTGIVITVASLVAGIVGLAMYQGDTTARVDPAGP